MSAVTSKPPTWIITVLRDISIFVAPFLLAGIFFLAKDAYNGIVQSIEDIDTIVDKLPGDIEDRFEEDFDRLNTLVDLNKITLTEVQVFNARQEEINRNFMDAIARNTEDIEGIEERVNDLENARFGALISDEIPFLSETIPFATITDEVLQGHNR